MEVKLQVKEYKISIERDGDDIIEKPETQEEVDNYTLHVPSIVALPEEAKKVAGFNERQLTYCKHDKTKDFILKRIINNQ